MNRITSFLLTVFLVSALWVAYYFISSDLQKSSGPFDTHLQMSKSRLQSIEQTLNDLSTDNQSKVSSNSLRDFTQPQTQNESDAIIMRAQKQHNQLKEEITYLRNRLNEQEITQRRLRLQLEEKTQELINAKKSLLNSYEIENLALTNQDLQQKLNKLTKELNSQKTTPKINENTDQLLETIAVQEEKITEINRMCEKLKTQLITMAGIMARRDNEVITKENEILSLKSQINGMSIKLSDFKESLLESEKNQKLIAQKLKTMKNINNTFGKHLTQAVDCIEDSPAEPKTSDFKKSLNVKELK
ncbi:MAG: hypothetical protein GY858_05020 [Candidatus Omnitrophica bacterium]|nr:hypothetical protein [Candidatus Omnitrophota bacterium]